MKKTKILELVCIGVILLLIFIFIYSKIQKIEATQLKKKTTLLVMENNHSLISIVS
ncbi:MAG: hypothetical protein ACKVOQ_19895 [Cyclobacteriaceae bacterium]